MMLNIVHYKVSYLVERIGDNFRPSCALLEKSMKIYIQEFSNTPSSKTAGITLAN